MRGWSPQCDDNFNKLEVELKERALDNQLIRIYKRSMPEKDIFELTVSPDKATELFVQAISHKHTPGKRLIMPDSGGVQFLADGLAWPDPNQNHSEDELMQYVVTCFRRRIKPFKVSRMINSGYENNFALVEESDRWPTGYASLRDAALRQMLMEIDLKGPRAHLVGLVWGEQYPEPTTLNAFRRNTLEVMLNAGYKPMLARWEYPRAGFNNEIFSFRVTDQEAMFRLTGDKIDQSLQDWFLTLQEAALTLSPPSP